MPHYAAFSLHKRWCRLLPPVEFVKLRLTSITHAANDNSRLDMLRVFVGGDRLAPYAMMKIFIYAMMKIFIFYCICCRYVV